MGSYRILPLRKIDGVAFLIRGLYKKPIDLAAVQNQSLELWPESLKAGDLRFLYRSLMVFNTASGFWFAVLEAPGRPLHY